MLKRFAPAAPATHSSSSHAMNAVGKKTFAQLWRELSDAGWKARRPKGLSNDFTYVMPNVVGDLSGATKGVDYFVGTSLSRSVRARARVQTSGLFPQGRPAHGVCAACRHSKMTAVDFISYTSSSTDWQGRIVRSSTQTCTAITCSSVNGSRWSDVYYATSRPCLCTTSYVCTASCVFATANIVTRRQQHSAEFSRRRRYRTTRTARWSYSG